MTTSARHGGDPRDVSRLTPASTAFSRLIDEGGGIATSSGSRRAAVALHGMSREDRSWVLSELEPDQRATLVPLLDELEAMVMPADVAVIEQELSGRADVVPVPDSGTDLVRQLAAMPVDAVASVLLDEPDALITRLLRLRTWPWREALMARLDTERRAQIGRFRPDDRAGPVLGAFERALIEETLARAAGACPDGEAAAACARPPASDRIKAIWRRWRVRA